MLNDNNMVQSSDGLRELSSLYPPVGRQHPGDLKDNPPIPEHHPTVGYRLTHFMLRIRDPRSTLHFYIDLMGMRTIFTTNTGPFTIYYLAYPQTPAHRADPSVFSRDMIPHSVLSRTLGLLELCHYHGSENQPTSYISNGNTPPHLGFNHLGFTVPNVKSAVDRLREQGVKIVKDIGEGPVEGIPTTTWEKATHGIATDPLDPTFERILQQIAFVEDPNGYFVELVPQEFTIQG
ncbi:Lactoylglutathione lyase [Scedosporium apiospermum]|uniref:Lactoylglutathione lyase n=1 Tax=Pseudallescheria apiosperma TaxID=563466 RepID=A0A084GCI5_PSEDA|nr:Lactoylglutathione lyase [Scedosporium apiospermum]KEZ45047.1 Lactoylglutathione lyase [Scedosporium apiospermum]